MENWICVFVYIFCVYNISNYLYISADPERQGQKRQSVFIGLCRNFKLDIHRHMYFMSTNIHSVRKIFIPIEISYST
jgi:hypothetical protein